MLLGKFILSCFRKNMGVVVGLGGEGFSVESCSLDLIPSGVGFDEIWYLI